MNYYFKYNFIKEQNKDDFIMFFFFALNSFIKKYLKKSIKSILLYLLTAEEMFITDFYGICCIYMYVCFMWTMVMSIYLDLNLHLGIWQTLLPFHIFIMICVIWESNPWPWYCRPLLYQDSPYSFICRMLSEPTEAVEKLTVNDKGGLRLQSCIRFIAVMEAGRYGW